jgi:hypothetical protein
MQPLKKLFTSLSTWLMTLKYAGLALAASSSIWATFNELTVTAPEGHKRVTVAGVVSIGLTLLGLLISFLSQDLERRRTAKVAKEQVATEATRTNEIIIAGQPLTSLSLTWSFHGIDCGLAELLKKGDDDALAVIMDAQGGRGGEQNRSLYRGMQLYPFLLGLARSFARVSAKPDLFSILILVALDDDPNTVLPFGLIDNRVLSSWLQHSKIPEAPSLPSLETNMNACLGNSDLRNWPSLEASESDVIVYWRLDPSTFAKCISRQNNFVAPTAKMPHRLRIAALFDLSGLPFRPGNFALPVDENFWNFPDYQDNRNSNFRGTLDPITSDFTSSVELVPNNSDLVAYSYNLSRVYETLFRDGYGEAIKRLRCIVMEYEAE